MRLRAFGNGATRTGIAQAWRQPVHITFVGRIPLVRWLTRIPAGSALTPGLPGGWLPWPREEPRQPRGLGDDARRSRVMASCASGRTRTTLRPTRERHVRGERAGGREGPRT